MPMRILSASEMNLVAGGSDPKMVCEADPVTVARNGNTTVTTSGNNCQTSSGLTIVKSTETTVFSADLGLSGIVKRLVDGHAQVNWVNTKQTTTTCDSKNDCKTVIKESNPQHQGSDLGDGSAFEGFADFGSESWGDNADWGDGGAWAGGESGGFGGGGGGGGGGTFYDEYEVAMC